MNKLFSRFSSSQGDTIVEVLVAIIIVSMILAGSYTSSTRSSQVTRTAQERGEALKVAESQTEAIRKAVDARTPDVIAPNDFCIDASGNLQIVTPCSFVRVGVTYKVTTEHQTSEYVFSVKVVWDAFGGGINNAELDYEAQPPLVLAAANSAFLPDLGGQGPNPNPGPKQKDPILKYRVFLTNKTNSAFAGQIASCNWRWGNGPPEDSTKNTKCEPGDTINYCYWKSGDPEGKSPPSYPAGLGPGLPRNYTVTLEVTLNDGRSGSKTYQTNQVPRETYNYDPKDTGPC